MINPEEGENWGNWEKKEHWTCRTNRKQIECRFKSKSISNYIKWKWAKYSKYNSETVKFNLKNPCKIQLNAAYKYFLNIGTQEDW